MAGPQQQLCWQPCSGKCTVPPSPGRSSLIQAPRAATSATVLPTPHQVLRPWAGATHTDGPQCPSSSSLHVGGDAGHGHCHCLLTWGVWNAFEVMWGASWAVGLCLSFPGAAQGSRVGTGHGKGSYHGPSCTIGKHSGAAGERVGTDLARKHHPSPEPQC